MDRRTTLKNLLAGAAGAALLAKTTGCREPELINPAEAEAQAAGYGLRFPHEIKHDQRIANDSFFTEAEKTDLGILADIITPGTETEPKATDTGIVDFFEFMALDQPEAHQNILRGGLAWINLEASDRFGKYFADLTPAERIAIVDDIAYPEEAEETPFAPGAIFFDRLRFLTLTGYFTSKEGIKTLDYQGNAPNVWEGVPQEVLDKHGLAYDPKYLDKYVDQSKRDVQAEWDEEGNLIS